MIIIVEDRGLVADALRASFAREGVSASGLSFDEFEEWISTATEDDIDVVEAILIGECDGAHTLTSHIKERCAAAVIALKDDKNLDSTLGLFAEGVDDVIVKPCHVREILARIEAIRRRAGVTKAIETYRDDIHTFRDGRDPIVGGRPMSLPRRELRILEFLASRRSRRVTKSQIFSAVYGLFDHEIDENVIESHISKLRRRLRDRLGYDPIESQRHLGYRLVGRSMLLSGDAAPVTVKTAQTMV
ncbi:MAG: response regulator transcription factor [Hyphomicrobiaceae bacterium]